MDYEKFLLSQLLRDNIEEYNELSYDILWDKTFDIYNKYKENENTKIDLYSDIENFIKENEKYLIELILKFII